MFLLGKILLGVQVTSGWAGGLKWDREQKLIEGFRPLVELWHYFWRLPLLTEIFGTLSMTRVFRFNICMHVVQSPAECTRIDAIGLVVIFGH